MMTPIMQKTALRSSTEQNRISTPWLRFLRTDFKPAKGMRVIAALRADKFSSPDDVYLAYELATTYSINDKNLIRAAITRSNSGSFISITKLNLTVPTAIGIPVHRSGNEDVKLFTVDMIEIGYRSQLSKSLQIDFDVFTQTADNFNALLIQEIVSSDSNGCYSTQNQFINVPTTARQSRRYVVPEFCSQ